MGRQLETDNTALLEVIIPAVVLEEVAGFLEGRTIMEGPTIILVLVTEEEATTMPHAELAPDAGAAQEEAVAFGLEWRQAD